MVFDKFFEQRAVDYQTVFESGDDVSFGTLSSTNVNSDTIFQVNAVFSAISLIADTISTLPLDCFIRENETRNVFRPRPTWVQQPDVDIPREAFYSAVISSLLLEGNSFIRVYSNPRGEVVNLVVLNPLQVAIRRNNLGRLMFVVDGEDKPLGTDEVIFIPDVVRAGDIRGVSRVKALKENFGLAMALEKFAASFYGTGTNLSGIIEFPGNLSAEQAQNLANGFDNRHKGWRKGHKTGVLSGGATFKATQIDPQQSQAVESRHLAVEDIARAFNVPPHLLALPGTNSYASVEQTNLAWATHGLRPIVTKIESALSPLLRRYSGGEDAFLKFNLDGLYRADIQSRMSAYSTGLQSGFLTINDVRKLEDLAPMEDESANVVRVPLANVDLTESHVKAQRERVEMAKSLVMVGFDPKMVLDSLELPEIDHTGVPSTQLQAVSMIDPENPDSVYKDEVTE
jgi:HK97 family phage portal protein